MKIPNQIYVTLKKQTVREYNEQTQQYEIVSYGPHLGFMQPYNPKKPDDKKHVTQLEWAYGHYGRIKLENRAGTVWAVGQKQEYDWATRQYILINVDEPVDPQPLLLDNTPLHGFKIQKFVSRYSTSNKVWRILDPRGFELEVSTPCLDELMGETDILKGGIIVEKCVWYTNKQLKVAK